MSFVLLNLEHKGQRTTKVTKDGWNFHLIEILYYL